MLTRVDNTVSVQTHKVNVLTITVVSAVTISVNLLTIIVAFATFSVNVLNITVAIATLSVHL